jgi:hypothetical protein
MQGKIFPGLNHGKIIIIIIIIIIFSFRWFWPFDVFLRKYFPASGAKKHTSFFFKFFFRGGVGTGGKNNPPLPFGLKDRLRFSHFFEKIYGETY